MRLLEIVSLLLLLPYILWPLVSLPRPRWVDFLPATAMIAVVAQLLSEGYRWQMLPAYLLVLLLFFLSLPRLRRAPEQAAGDGRKPLALLAFGGWLLALALPVLLPVPSLPPASGPYAVGTQTTHLVDENRPEIYSVDADDSRELMVQLWYPAPAGAEGVEAAYLPELEVMGAALAGRLGLPSFLLDHINLVDLDITRGAPLLSEEAPYPVLLFSHGLRGMRVQNTALMRELASLGFVVAAIDHTYANVMTIFPGGRVVPYNPRVLDGQGDPPRTANRLVAEWAADSAFVLDTLAAWNEEGGAWQGALDLERVGALGHSTGGGAAVELCGRDTRCDAVVGLDAWLGPVSADIIESGLDQPLLLLRAATWEFDDAGVNDARAEALWAHTGPTSYLGTIDGVSHYDFSDVPLLSPLTPRLGLSGDLDSAYTVEMVNSLTAAFLRQVLQDAGPDTLREALVYPEVRLK